MSEREIARRRLIARARMALLTAMEQFTGDEDGLTPMEWLECLQGLQARTIAEGLKQEWPPQPTRT